MKLQNEYEQAVSSEHIWGRVEVMLQKEEEQECIEDQAVKCMGSQSSLHVPFTDEIKHNYLNPEGVNHVSCTSKDARNLKENPNFQENVTSNDGHFRTFAPLPLFQSNKVSS